MVAALGRVREAKDRGLNAAQIYSKTIFGNALQDHVVAVKSITAQKIVSDPNYLLKFHPLSEKQDHEGPDGVPESEWVAHFESQFVKPTGFVA